MLCVVAILTYHSSAAVYLLNIGVHTFLDGLDSMASNLSEADRLLEQWNGQIVPRSFNGGFVTLSYIVSLIGAASTLELINRRTAPKGRVNQYVVTSKTKTQ